MGGIEGDLWDHFWGRPMGPLGYLRFEGGLEGGGEAPAVLQGLVAPREHLLQFCSLRPANSLKGELCGPESTGGCKTFALEVTDMSSIPSIHSTAKSDPQA